MNKFLKFVLTVPAFAGAYFAGYFVAKKKYEKLADKEVADVKEKLNKYYEGKEAPSKDDKTKCKKEEKKVEITRKSSIERNQTTEEKYFNYAKPYMTETVANKVEAEKEATKKDKKGNTPYVISMADYENSNYIAKSLYYYLPDNLFTDSDGRHIDNPEEIVGASAMQEVLKEENDTVYVRNERLEADFEIIIVPQSLYSKGSKERVIPEEYE